MHIIPNWAKSEYADLEYTEEYFRDTKQLDSWKSVGHHLPSTTIFISPVVTPTQFTKFIESQFPRLTNMGICFHLLPPGHYLPLHTDAYGFYTKKYNITNIDKIHRYIMFLEDSQPGHLLSIGNNTYSSWSAGQVYGFAGATVHGATNLGMTHRYTLQITGIVNE